MSTEIRQELKIVPAQASVVKHVRYTYACRRCDREAVTTPVITAAMPVLPGSLVSPSAMAFVMTGKYIDGLPLYRQEQSLSRLGIDISRQTMANWMIQGAERWLFPLYERMHELILKQEILHADETTLQVLHEPGRAATSKSYLWLYRTGQTRSPIVLYDYQTTRASKHPCRFLNGFKGYLQVDGYSGYNRLEEITLVGCWAHARRKFDEALKVLPPEKKDADVAAKRGLEFCNRLFALERELKKVSPEERYRIRLKRGRPIVDEFKEWLDYQRPKVLPKSAFGQAIGYSLKQWQKLNAERSIKPFVIGRKNWLFANTPRGAKASATIYSIVETAKENGLNPFAYLQYLFEQLPNIDLNDQCALDELLPWSESLLPKCRKYSEDNKEQEKPTS